MAIDDRFSLSAFRSSQDPRSKKELKEALQGEILRELDGVIQQVFLDIVRRLNLLGHNLREYEPRTPGALNYRDDDESLDKYVCRLLLGVDTVVTVAFGNEDLWDGSITDDEAT